MLKRTSFRPSDRRRLRSSCFGAPAQRKYCKSMSAAEVGNSSSKLASTSGCTVPKTPILAPILAPSATNTSAHLPSRKDGSAPCLMA
eukprot:252748-Pleurochrysis_carterae.AAC.2